MKPPIYIGLRANLYGPAATNLRGGSIGAGVPSPRVTNVATQANGRVPPAAIKAMPNARVQRAKANPRGASYRPCGHPCPPPPETMNSSLNNAAASPIVHV